MDRAEAFVQYHCKYGVQNNRIEEKPCPSAFADETWLQIGTHTEKEFFGRVPYYRCHSKGTATNMASRTYIL